MMVKENIEISLIVPPKEASRFFEELEKELQYSNNNGGEYIMGFTGEPNEDGYYAEINMYASLENDGHPWTELVIYNNKDEEIFNTIENFNIVNKFVKTFDNKKTISVYTCLACDKNVFDFAIDIINTEGFFLQDNMNGSFYLMSKEFNSTTMDGQLFDNMKDLMSALEAYHKKYVYPDWEEAINFLEDEKVTKILEKLTPYLVLEKQYNKDDDDIKFVPNYSRYTKYFREWQEVYQIAKKYNKINEVASLLNFLRNNMINLQKKVQQEAEKEHIKDWEIADIPQKI